MMIKTPKILYHVTFLPPQRPECVAEIQEIQSLCRRLGGEIIYLNPNSRARVYWPRFFFGFHKLSELRRREANLDLHHLYNPDPFAFPILRLLKRPVVYTISGGVGAKRPNIGFFDALSAVIVPDRRSAERLKAWGMRNVFQVRAGIETSRLTYSSLPLKSEIHLMAGSAPWTRAQFHTKGVEALLKAASLNPRLRLVFLWRGVLTDEIKNLVRQLGLGAQVQVLDRQVDVNQVLADVHASVALATQPGILKAYPHSLLESLAAGKPVLVSRAIPMADYVEHTGCGVVVENVTPCDILAAVEALADAYAALQVNAQQVGQRDFTLDTMIASFRHVYEQIL